jgi:sensor c-di-GMP phosphodiesterase-like protein
MRASIQRFLIVCLVVVICAALGGVAGGLFVRNFLLGHALKRVGHYADYAVDRLSSSTGESRRVLALMNASADGFCSTAEIDRFRTLVFQSQFLKEAGRIRDGRLVCSTTLGRLTDTQALPRPDFTQKDGTRVYRNLQLFRVAGYTTVAVQLGDSFIVYSPFNNSDLSAPQTSFAVTSVDTTSNSTGLVYGKLPQIDGHGLTQSTQTVGSGLLYATRCSAQGIACVTVYMQQADALAGGGSAMALLAVIGAVVGGLLGFLCSRLYRRKRSLPSQLAQALREDALTVVYQPIVDLESGCIVEAEALARWTDDDGNPISPEIFVKIAEERGFVGEITRLVVRRTLGEFARTLRTRRYFRISVNVAAPDLADPSFLPMLQDALEQAGVSPENLGIEITESFTARQQVAKETIAHLRQRGHHVAIDDFGTGYSSLAYLHDLSVDAIKIDKAFTRAIGTDEITVSILPQILSMATELGLNVTVEGIETPEQARYFAGTGKSIRMQGWLYGHPVSAEAFQQMLDEGPVRPLYPPTLSGPASVTEISSIR